METERAMLVTTPLSRADQADLLEHLPEDGVEFRPAKLAPGELGEPATAVAIIALSMVAITGLCAWVAVKGRGIRVTFTVKAPGVSSEFTATVDEQSKPEDVRKQVEAKGIPVPEK